MNTVRGTIIYGKQLEIGDDLEFLGKSHIITSLEPYTGSQVYPGAPVRFYYPADTRIAHAAPNWSMTVEGLAQFFLCPTHNWWTQTGCYKCMGLR